MALARCATGPLSPHLPAFVTSLIDKGYAIVCVRAMAWRAAEFDAWLSVQGVCLAQVEDSHVEAFLRRPYQPRSDCRDTPRRHERASVRQLLQYLRAHGLCAATALTVTPADELAASFAEHLKHERGLATTTIGGYQTLARSFLWCAASAATTSISARCVPPTSSALFGRRRSAFAHEDSSWSSRVAGLPSLCPVPRRDQSPLIAAVPAVARGQPRHRCPGPSRRSTRVGSSRVAIPIPPSAGGTGLFLLLLASAWGCARARSDPAGCSTTLTGTRVAAAGTRQGAARSASCRYLTKSGEAIAAYLRDGRPVSADRHLFAASPRTHPGFAAGIWTGSAPRS